MQKRLKNQNPDRGTFFYHKYESPHSHPPKPEKQAVNIETTEKS